MALVGSLIEDPAGLQPLERRWDDLAVAAGAPFGAPAWTLAWWRHLAPRRPSLSVVAVRDGDELVGLAPFYSPRRLGTTELKLLSGGFASRLGILASPGREFEVGQKIAEALVGSELRPDSIHWEALDAASPWPETLSEQWPDEREHHIREESQRSAPVLHLAQDSYEEWLSTKSSNFRQQLRKKRRRIEAQGAVFRSTDRSSLRRDLESFWELHRSRWEERGGSAIADQAVDMLEEVGSALIDEGRFRLWMIEGPGGEPVSAQIYVAAGREVAFWNLGFSEHWAKHSPGLLTTLEAIKDAFERNDELLDFGGGEGSFKDRLTDEDRPVAWRTSYPAGPRYPLARLSHLPKEVARRSSGRLRERLGQERLNRLRTLARR